MGGLYVPYWLSPTGYSPLAIVDWLSQAFIPSVGSHRLGGWSRLWHPGRSAAVAAMGPGEGGSPKRLHKAPTDYSKPRQTIQSPNRLDRASKRLY